MSTEVHKKALKFINCENFDVVGSCYVKYNGKREHGMHMYYPATFLIYVEHGNLEIDFENTKYKYTEGDFCLVRKYTNAYFAKVFSEEKGESKSYTFIMPDVFLRKITAHYKFEKNLQSIGDRIIKITPNEGLKSIVNDVKSTLDDNMELSTVAFEAKVENTFKTIIDTNPKLAILFKEFSLAQRADLTLFMYNNYMYKQPLETMAKLSGRSLSTFNREFKLIFNTTPHRWILKKRLQLAYDLLINTNDTVGDIYLQAGFEDLAHFSKAFKKEYGINPSEVKKQSQADFYLA